MSERLQFVIIAGLALLCFGLWVPDRFHRDAQQVA
jgi:hypothetical protein